MPMLIWEQFLLAHSQRNNSGDFWFCVVWPERSRSLSFHTPRTCSLVQGWRAFGIDFYGLTFDILLLLSPVKNAKLLISFWITKFCSSLLKFWVGGTEKQTLQESLPRCVPFTMTPSPGPPCVLTWDLHHRMKISATMRKSWSESASGLLSQLDLRRKTNEYACGMHQWLRQSL